MVKDDTADRPRTTAARSWLTLLLAMVVTATTLVSLPASAGADESALAACARGWSAPLGYGVPVGWEVMTEVDDDGSARWRYNGEPEHSVRGERLQSDVHGAGAKEDRLVTGVFVATAETAVTFSHGYVLGPDSGGLLEVTVDAGQSWEQIGSEHLTGHTYQGTTATGQPAFTGAVPDLTTGDLAHSTVDLHEWSGQEVRLAWRLSAAEGTTPGWWALRSATLRGIADPACVDGRRPELRCTTTTGARFTDGLPEGWAVSTPVNESNTPVWTTRADAFNAPWGITGAATDATGLDAKDDRLVSAPFTATPSSWLGFRHRFALEPGRDGGVLEVSTDGGTSWEQLEADRFQLGSYQGNLPDGRPAWSGTHLHADEPAGFQNFLRTTVDLSDFDGHEIRISWRLLQDEARTDSVPGHEWFLASPIFGEIVDDADCTVTGTAPPDTCHSLDPPDAIGARGATDDGEVVQLNLLVSLDVEEGADIALLEQTDPAEAHARMAELEEEMRELLIPMERAYEPLGIETIMAFELLAPLDEDGQPRERPEDVDRNVIGSVPDGTGYAYELVEIAKEQYGHKPPAGFDAVYSATDVQMAPVGVANCVGGIAYPQHSFASGQLERGTDDELGARIAAHEIGHLLGAQHHYANCAEALPDRGVSTDYEGLCTIMSNDVDLTWLTFSTVNGAVVRGYATTYADRGA